MLGEVGTRPGRAAGRRRSSRRPGRRVVPATRGLVARSVAILQSPPSEAETGAPRPRLRRRRCRCRVPIPRGTADQRASARSPTVGAPQTLGHPATRSPTRSHRRHRPPLPVPRTAAWLHAASRRKLRATGLRIVGRSVRHGWLEQVGCRCGKGFAMIWLSWLATAFTRPRIQAERHTAVCCCAGTARR